MRISGGYYIKARCIDKSAIAKAPPHVREIWDYLLRKAYHKDVIISGQTFKRGSLLTSYKAIIEDLSWYVGWRVEKYTKHHCEIAMKWLKKADMITTMKTTRGFIVNLVNYDFYQDPKNYENHNENAAKATRKPQTTDTIYKNDKNVKKEKNIYTAQARKILDYLNLKTGKKFKPVQSHLDTIGARLKEGNTMEDCKRVIDIKASQWQDTEHDKYLRPQTLFSSSKFDSYLNEREYPKKKAVNHMTVSKDFSFEERIEKMQREKQQRGGISQ
jgi:uncharacterized phage protein (TIGR02220 family)